MTTDRDLGEGKSCFIVGPIGSRLAPVGAPGRLIYEDATQMWEKVFEPATHVFGLEPVRSDKIAESGEIPEQIFTYLRDADVVIADLTGGNANVMYELGLRHTRDLTTIQIGQYGTLPFDVNTIRTIQFNRTDAGLIDARNELIEALRVALAGRGSPVTATRVWADTATTVDPTDFAAASKLSFQADDPSDIEDEGPGILDRLAEGEIALEEATDVLNRITDWMGNLSTLSETIVPSIESSEGFAPRLLVVRQLADQLAVPAEELNGLAEEFDAKVRSIDEMVKIIISQVQADPEELDGDAWGFLQAMVGMSDSSTEANVGMSEARQGARSLRQMSKVLAPASKSIERSLTRIVTANSMIGAWASEIRELSGWVEPEPDSEELDTSGE